LIGGSGVIDIGTPLPIYFAAAAAAALDPHPYARLVARSFSLEGDGQRQERRGGRLSSSSASSPTKKAAGIRETGADKEFPGGRVCGW